MTDDLAEAKRHIRALLDILCRGVNGDPMSVGRAQRYLDGLDAEGQQQAAPHQLIGRPFCPICNAGMLLHFWPRPGGAPGNGYICPNFEQHKAEDQTGGEGGI